MGWTVSPCLRSSPAWPEVPLWGSGRLWSWGRRGRWAPCSSPSWTPQVAVAFHSFTRRQQDAYRPPGEWGAESSWSQSTIRKTKVVLLLFASYLGFLFFLKTNILWVVSLFNFFFFFDTKSQKKNPRKISLCLPNIVEDCFKSRSGHEARKNYCRTVSTTLETPAMEINLCLWRKNKSKAMTQGGSRGHPSRHF